MLKLFAKKNTLKCDIITIQKLWKNDQYNCTYNSIFDRFELLYHDKKITKICLFVNKNLTLFSWNAIHHTTNFFTLKLKTKNSRIINIHNIYNSKMTTSKANKSIMLLKKKLKKTSNENHITLKNFNLHHSTWKKVETDKKNKKADILIKIAKTHDLNQLLTSKTITYSNKKHNFIINLIFAIFLLFDDYINCRTKFDQHFSNHHSIKTIFNLKTMKQFIFEKKQFKKTNFEKLKKSMIFELNHMPANQLKNSKKINEQIKWLMIVIQNSIETSTQLIRIFEYFMSNFDEKCKKTVTTINRLHKTYQKTKNQKNWVEYVNVKNWKKTFIRKMKRKTYKEFKKMTCENSIIMWKASKFARKIESSLQACISTLKKKTNH